MEKDSSFLKSKSSFAILLIVLILYSVLIITTYHHERLNGDSILHLSIAEKYIRGDFSNAINGYWGPFLAWLLIPFLYFGSTHIFAINSLNLIFGLLTIIGVWILSCRFEITEKIRSIILISLLPIILYYSLVQPTDFLLLCILVYYLSIVFKNDYPNSLYNGILSGVLGAFAYFAKAYAFPFFISHFLLINTGHYLKSTTKLEKKNVLRNAIVGIVLFSIISGIWVVALSNKYNYLTFATTGKFNFAVYGPGPEGRPKVYMPILYDGFFEPFNKTAVVAWEDPSYLKIKTWSPLESWSSFKHFIRHILGNISHVLRIYESFSTLSITIIIAYILLFFVQPFNKQSFSGNILYPLLTVILYTGGYVPHHFNPRYIWIVNILLLLMGGYLLNVLFQNEFFKNSSIRKNILIVFFILSFIASPLKAINKEGKYNIDKEMYTLSTKLKQYNIQGNIASNREYIPTNNAWSKTFRLAYHLNSRYYGQPKESISDQDLESDLKKHNIDYYFVWGESDNTPQFLSNYREITSGEIPNLKIYSLKKEK